MNSQTYKKGELTVCIGNNEAEGELHREGYNGVFSLTSKHEALSPFVPLFAGLNLEHIWDGSEDDGEILFQPRRVPMEFKPLAGNKCQLYQAPTPRYGLESWTEFTIVEPYYIDFRFRCKPHRDTFRRGYLGLFWASYINGPENKAIYYRGQYPGRDDIKWLALATQHHGHDSTVVHVDDKPELSFMETERKDWLFMNFSPLRYVDPFFFGRFKDMALNYMFDRSKGIRITHSPSGGGTHRFPDYENPAWDFQYIVPDPQVNSIYSFRARFAYKKYIDREDVMNEYITWQDTLGSEGE